MGKHLLLYRQHRPLTQFPQMVSVCCLHDYTLTTEIQDYVQDRYPSSTEATDSANTASRSLPHPSIPLCEFLINRLISNHSVYHFLIILSDHNISLSNCNPQRIKRYFEEDASSTPSVRTERLETTALNHNNQQLDVSLQTGKLQGHFGNSFTLLAFFCNCSTRWGQNTLLF